MQNTNLNYSLPLMFSTESNKVPHPILKWRQFMLEEDRPLLHKLAEECKDAKEHDRCLALRAASEGYEVSLVAKIFCVDGSSVCGWMKRLEPKTARSACSLVHRNVVKFSGLITFAVGYNRVFSCATL